MPKGNVTAVLAWGIRNASATRLMGIAGKGLHEERGEFSCSEVVRRISVSGEAGCGGQNPHIDSAGRPKRAYYQLKDARAIFA